MSTIDRRLIGTDPDQTIKIVLKDLSTFIETEYGRTLTDSNFFNLQRLSHLIGSQFVIADEARKNGLIIEDCEMCSCFDRQLSYCTHYNQILKMETTLYFYHKGLCPAMVVK